MGGGVIYTHGGESTQYTYTFTQTEREGTGGGNEENLHPPPPKLATVKTAYFLIGIKSDIKQIFNHYEVAKILVYIDNMPPPPNQKTFKGYGTRYR